MSDMQSPLDMTPEQAAAAAAAAESFNIELFTLLAIGVLVTILRTYARISTAGWKGLDTDDYLVWAAVIFYGAESALAYSVGSAAMGLANNGMTDEYRAALDPSGVEYGMRVLGSKIQLAGWSTYGTLLWCLKLSLLFFYLRLTSNLDRNYLIRIYIGFAFIVVSYLVVILNLFLGCLPFDQYWQINPNPGDTCQPAVSARIVWVFLALNVSTDLYLLSIPLPMLWMAKIKLLKKLGLMFVFGGGFLVIACATLRCVLIVTDPINGAQLAGSWAVRETFIAVVTTNLPMIFPMVNRFLFPLFGKWMSTIRSTHPLSKTPKEILPHYDGATDSQPATGKGTFTSTTVTSTAAFSESEEQIVGNDRDVKLQDLYPSYAGMSPSPSHSRNQYSTSARSGNSWLDSTADLEAANIKKEVEITVVNERRADVDGDSSSDADDRAARELQQRDRALASIQEGVVDARRSASVASNRGQTHLGGQLEGNYAYARGPTPDGFGDV